MPLLFAPKNSPVTIVNVAADEKCVRHLGNLGILKGGSVTLLSENGGNVILKVKDGRLALDSTLAAKIFVR